MGGSRVSVAAKSVACALFLGHMAAMCATQIPERPRSRRSVAPSSTTTS
jgi:hypothetical protein